MRTPKTDKRLTTNMLSYTMRNLSTICYKLWRLAAAVNNEPEEDELQNLQPHNEEEWAMMNTIKYMLTSPSVLALS